MNTEAHKVLGDILKTGIDVHRCAAARAFATIGGPGAVADLIPALLDEDPDVRTDAAQSLSAIGDPAAATQLMENLIGDPEADVKKAALEALIAFGHAPVAPLLRKLAVARTSDIFWDEDEFYNDGWDSWLDFQLIAIRGLASFASEDAVQDILTAMGDEQGQDVSETGVAALSNMGVEGAVALEQLFPISDPRLQRRIAEGVMRAANPHVKGQIDGFLTDPSARIRAIAAGGLKPGDPRLEPLFSDPDAGVRVTVLRRVGHKFSNHVKALIADSSPAVRTEVFRIIAAQADDYRDESTVKLIKKAIKGDTGAAKQAALALIALKGAEAVKGLSHVMTNKKVPLDFRVGAVEALEMAGPSSAPHLLRASADESRRLRLSAMTALAGLAANDPVWPNAAGDGLIGALNGTLIVPSQQVDEKPQTQPEPGPEIAPVIAKPDDEVDNTTPLVAEPGSTLDRILADASPGPDLAGMDAEEDADTPTPVELSAQDERFLELSKQRRMSKRKMPLESDIAPYLDVRRFAATVLGGVANVQVTEQLISVLADEDRELARDALNSLVQHGDTMGTLPQSAYEPLLEIFVRPDAESARVLALRAIGKLSVGAQIVLRESLDDDDPHLRVEAVRGLDHLGIADAQIEAALNDDYIGVAIAAAHSLARNRGEAAAEALIEFAFRNDGTHRRDVGRLLGQYAPVSGMKHLIELAVDEAHLRERLVVIDALAEVIASTTPGEDSKVA